MLAFIQLVADKRAIWLLGNVVGRIQNPQHAGGHPNGAAERHDEQGQAAKNGANQKVWRSPAPARDGAVAHGAHDGLDDQARHGPCQPQQGETAFLRAQIGVDRAHIGLLQAETVLQPKEPKVHIEDLGKRQKLFVRHFLKISVGENRHLQDLACNLYC